MNTDRKQAAQKALRELGIPALAGAVAAGAGIVLRRKPDMRRVVPDVKGGVGDLVDDLRSKVQTVVGKGGGALRGNAGGGDDSAGRDTQQAANDELTERRRTRERRRNERRSQSGQ